MALNMDAALTIRARTVGTQSVDKLNQSLRQTTGAANKAGGSLATAGAQAQKGGAGFVALRGALTPLAAMFTAGAIIQGVKDTLEVFAEFEADSLALEQGLKNRGAAYVAAFDQLQTAADKLGEITLFNNDDFRKGFAQLTTFSNIAVEDYERIGIAAANIAQANNTSVSASFLQLAKAINDPVQNLSALSRSGIQFTEAQKTMIKGLIEAGRTADAQKIIFDELATQYGGVAEAAAKGSAGVADSWGEAVNRLQRAMGPFLAEAIVPVVKGLTTLVNFISQQVIPTFKDMSEVSKLSLVNLGPIPALVRPIENGFRLLGISIKDAEQAMRDLFAQLASFDLGAAFQGMGASIQNAFAGVGTAIGGLLNGLFAQVQGSLGGMISSIQNAMQGLINWLRSALRSAVNAANSAINVINQVPGVSAPTIPVPQFAAGGVVDRPTLALVGEAREREYIIPESKMSGAMAAWGAGARGGAVLAGAGGAMAGSPQISITTGPVIQQGGQNWVTTADLEAAVRSTATQIYATLRTPAGRRAIGVA